MNAENDASANLDRVLQQRAQQLAARRVESATRNEGWPGLVFALAGERFCVPLAGLIEVLPFLHCTLVPGAPPELLGVMNVRGEIRSVLDLARLLGLAVEGERPRGYVVLVRHAGTEVGLRVDEVDRIESVGRALLPVAEGHDGQESSSYEKRRTSSRALVLNLEELLSSISNLQPERKLL